MLNIYMSMNQGSRVPYSQKSFNAKRFQTPSVKQLKVQQNIRQKSSRQSLYLRAQDNNQDPKSKSKEEVQKLVDSLSKAGVTQEVALRVLKSFDEKNLKDSGKVRQQILKRSLTPTALILLQTGIDVGATFGAFTSGQNIDLGTPDFFAKPVVVFLLYFLTSYFFINVITDLFTLGTLLYAVITYGLKSDQLLQAVESIADRELGSANVVQKVQQSVDALKVFNILKSVGPLLQQQALGQGELSTLDNLTATLTLQKANEIYKMDWNKLGLSEDEAQKVAFTFSKFDTNDNFKIEALELRELTRSLGKELSQEEAKEAIKLLDSNNNGVIDFNEFLQWYTGKTPAKSDT